MAAAGYARPGGLLNDDHLPAIYVPVWTLLYGLALHAAGFFMPRGIRWVGWIFVAIGLLMLLRIPPFWLFSPTMRMGIYFGGLHLAYGIYLYFTEPRKNEA